MSRTRPAMQEKKFAASPWVRHLFSMCQRKKRKQVDDVHAVSTVLTLTISLILVSFLSHRLMVKSRESAIFVDVICLQHDLDAL